MGYRYLGHGDKIVVSDSSHKNPDKAYKISWLLNRARGHVTQIWVYS
jgi:L-fucose mutarotase/ribose pyranase (RbsD/FucU family)